jgi:Zn-dependent metalloprotease
MLEQIVQNGSSAQSASAAQTLFTSQQLLEKRQAVALTTARSPLRGETAVAAVKQRAVYTANFSTRLPGTLARSEGSAAVPDVAVNEAYEGSGATFDLYHAIFGRNSIDNNGLRLISTVHYGKGYDNAFWDGEQMVYGDGDENLPTAQRLFNRFTSSLDVIAHELTHGVTQYEANLVYANQPGALNEAISDIFGSLVKQYLRGQTADQADWIIGEGLFTSNVKGVGIRSMKAPGTAYDDPVLGKDPQPAHMKDFVATAQDNGGVHINSGIINHAFYLTAIEIGGYAWEKAGRIWYKALTEKLTSNASFQDAADLTFEAAGELFGLGSPEQYAVRNGWWQVGITVTAVPGPSPTPPPQPTPEPTPEPTPDPTPEPTPEPSPEPTPEPSPEPTPGPTPQPAPLPDQANGCLTVLLRAIGLRR